MFEFALPWVLLLLPLPWLIWRWWDLRLDIQPSALRVPSLARFSVLTGSLMPSGISQAWVRWTVITIWCLLVLSASGPQWVGDRVLQPQTGRDIMLALDISGSMEIPDMDLDGNKVDRLTLVKSVARDFIRKRPDDRIGLILFGTHAYLQTPLTFDHKTVMAMLDDATVGLAGTQTALGDAIGLGIKRFRHTAPNSRVMILLTDGVNNAGAVQPVPAAQVAAAEHIKIYTIGIGADKLLLRSFMGQQVVDPSADLDEPTLKRIAQMTQGEFFRAKDAAGLHAVYQQIHALEPVNGKNRDVRPIAPLYPYPLSLAMLLCAMLMVRKYARAGRRGIATVRGATL